ncbi:MAG: KamA family protein [Bacteroidetes bacterium]|nr:KamA family protein [Bacteroidota bacterium]MBL6943779.1 KamA family protein [Bacteroidales bacterium]
MNTTEKQSLSVRSLTIVKKILVENPEINKIFSSANSYNEVLESTRKWALSTIQTNAAANNYYKNEDTDSVQNISWKDIGVIRFLNYLDNEGITLPDPNRKNNPVTSSPIKNLYNAVKYGKGECSKEFFLDMLFLFRQINGRLKQKFPSEQKIRSWMSKYPSGLSERIIADRKENKERILKVIIELISSGEQKSERYFFEEGMTEEEKYKRVRTWWNDYRFHLRFAVRTPAQLNQMLDYSLRPEKLSVLNNAYKAGIPFFINPYYLSLIDVNVTPGKIGADKSLRDYVFHSRQLVKEFGNIVAWEKEDIVEPGKPNAAGWLLPAFHNIHRRYPEVAIFIPNTRGRACGGLCVSCQRMYDFQSGHLNFNLEKLSPKMTWKKKMTVLLKYFEEDTQLRDILITGGDSFMNTEESLQEIFDGIYKVALRKKNANTNRLDGEKYAEITRVRLGTRLPAFLPQRITKEFVKILADFKTKASEIGIKQFVVQIHVQSAMEITPAMKEAVTRLLDAGWMVTNQLVFTAAASRRGYSNKLRKVLNEIGVISYYTFSVKGFMENYHNFATNERSVQEKTEEKIIGKLVGKLPNQVADIYLEGENIQKNLAEFIKKNQLPFLSTDTNVLNMPGVGKSMRFNTIGITNDGRRILEFGHDYKRKHSPVIDKMGKVIIIESKSIAAYLEQVENIGEDPADYSTIWGYSSSETEDRISVFQYPDYDFRITDRLTNYQGETE